MPLKRFHLTHDELRVLEKLALDQVRTPEHVVRYLVRVEGERAGFWPPDVPIDPIWIPEVEGGEGG